MISVSVASARLREAACVLSVRHRRRAVRRMDRPTAVPAVPEPPNPTITGHVRMLFASSMPW